MNGHSETRHCSHSYRCLGTVLLLGLLLGLGDLAYGDPGSKAAKELSNAFSAAATSAMPAVVSIKVEKAVEVGPMASGTPFGFNDPFGLFNDDLLRKFFGDRTPPRQRSPQKYFQHGQGSGFIISKDGYILTNNHVIAMLKPGTRIALEILRNGKTQDIEITLGERPSGKAQVRPKEAQHSEATLGLEVQNLTRDLADQFGHALGEGVIVASVAPGSTAGEAGIQPGDLIQSVNRQSVTSVDEFEKAIKATKWVPERGGVQFL